jgi:hypothetical protein
MPPLPCPAAGQVVVAVVFGVLILGGFVSCGVFLLVRKWKAKHAVSFGSKHDKAAKYYNADTWQDDL